MSLKIRKVDQMFSQFIRDRDGWKCQRCGKEYDKSSTRGRQGLHNSHYWGRGHENTRFEPDNCIALCYGCHKLWGHGDMRDQYTDFMKRKLGQTRFASLMIQAHQYHKKDDEYTKLILQMLIDDYAKNPLSYRKNRIKG